jgi:hypothetical protein
MVNLTSLKINKTASEKSEQQKIEFIENLSEKSF